MYFFTILSFCLQNAPYWSEKVVKCMRPPTPYSRPCLPEIYSRPNPKRPLCINSVFKTMPAGNLPQTKPEVNPLNPKP